MKLKEYEEVCPKCKGDCYYNYHSISIRCNKCGGSGKIDWLDKMYKRNKLGLHEDDKK